MPTSNNSSRYKRANLFLLRVWRDDADEHEHGERSERPDRMWHGVVQRTVSGEARSFEAKDEIIEVLEAMLYQDQPVRTGQRGKTGTKAGLRAGGNNQSEANEATEGSR